MNRFIPIVFTFILGTVSLSTFAAQMYKWVDEEGNVQFSQIPPKEQTDVETIKNRFPVKPPTVDDVKQTEETTNENSATEENEDPIVASCNRAKKHLKLLQSGEYLVFKDESGKYQEMSSEKHQQELTNAQKYVDDYCQKKTQESMME